MINYTDGEDTLLDRRALKKLQKNSNTSEKIAYLKDATKEEICARIGAAWSCFGKKQEIL